MKSSRIAALVSMLLLIGTVSLLPADQVEDTRAAMNKIVYDLNDNSYKSFHAAISQKDMTGRILGSHNISPEVAASFTRSFDATMESWFGASFPDMGGAEIVGMLVNFELDGNKGKALVRFRLPHYRYSYHLYELQLDRRGRLIIVDWLDYFQAYRFSEFAGLSLVCAMPTAMAARSLLSISPITTNDIFQTRELLKAFRDSAHERFFSILDDMNEPLQRDPFIVDLRVRVAGVARELDRYQESMLELMKHYPDNDLYALSYVDYYMWSNQYARALSSLQRFQKSIGIDDGATLSRMSALALALGDVENSAAFAARATTYEPALELGWWSLLRAQSSAEDFADATETLAHLEDHFGRTLDAAKLRKDRFRGFLKLAASQEFKDWRVSRE